MNGARLYLYMALSVLPTVSSAAFRLGLGNAVAQRSAELINKADDGIVHTGFGAAVYLPACGTDPLYSSLPTDLSIVTGIVPLGNVSPPPHTFHSDHLYYYVATSTVSIPVYAPGDIHVLSIASSEYLSATPSFTDYQVYFYPCRNVQSYYGHVKTLSADFLNKMGPFSTNDCTTSTAGTVTIRRCSLSTNFTMAAGDLIGTSSTLDFGSYDDRITPLAFISPSRITHSLQTVCPLDYFSSTLKSTMEARLGQYNGSTLRTIAPLCGTIMEDVANTIQGNWYFPGAPDNPENPHMALIHDKVTPTYGVISIGSSGPGSSGFWLFTAVHSGFVNRDSNEVTADGNIYCYDTTRDPFGNLTGNTEIFLFQLTSATTLRIDRQTAASCGSGPWAFSGTAVNYQR